MSLSIGIVGLPNVGKSTLFNALGGEALAANYPFATIEPNTAIVPVPNERLDVLRSMYDAAKVVPATITFVDIAGLVAGASKGEGLGNQFLANIRETDAIIHVVRAFESGDITHVADRVDPKEDIEVINLELCLADLGSLDKALLKVAKEAKSDPVARTRLSYLESLKRHLEAGTPLSALPSLDQAQIKDLHLLTAKPVIYVFNIADADLTDTTKVADLQALVAPARSVFVSAKLEEELKSLDAEEASEFLASYGLSEIGLQQLVTAAYETLGLQSYLTAGPKEVRAWTVRMGATAPQAAGVIHGDFERGFIAAQVVSYPDLIEAGSESAAKAAGKVRTEGRDYVMQPDDVVEFRFNV